MAAESGMSRSPGTCMTMGTASTMAAIIEAMGLSLPYNASIPAVDARRRALSHETGRVIVRMVKEGRTLSQVATRAAFENALRVHAAIGGSTNAVVHLLALAGRLGVPLALEDFDRLSRDVPLLVDLQPSGRFLMEDLHYAGGLPAVMKQLEKVLDPNAPTVAGHRIGAQYETAEVFNPEVIRTLDAPVKPDSGIWVLRGNLAPGGAVMKPSAASVDLLSHRGKAVVFETIEDFRARIDDPDLAVDETSILVLKGCGPKGYPGMPEVGNMPLPRKLLEKGVKDMLRISDARMSGTAYGAVILHVSPESDAGGPLAVVRNGDEIVFDGPGRTLNLAVSDAELESRLAAWRADRPAPKYTRGYAKLYVDHVLQADQGADLDFLVGASGSVVTRESH
jgi:dihydroxy-acid dehydratase